MLPSLPPLNSNVSSVTRNSSNDQAPQICFLQTSRFDSLASLIAAHLGAQADVVELDAVEPIDYDVLARNVLSADSVQNW